MKALESRSQLLDAALASADEANRRWEECRALVDQLRLENASLRAQLGQNSMLMPTVNGNGNSEGDANSGRQTQGDGPKPTTGVDAAAVDSGEA